MAKAMRIPLRVAEKMHWEIGEEELARRANTAVFHLAGRQPSRRGAMAESVSSASRKRSMDTRSCSARSEVLDRCGPPPSSHVQPAPDISSVMCNSARSADGGWELTVHIPHEALGVKVDEVIVRTTCPYVFVERLLAADGSPVGSLTQEKRRLSTGALTSGLSPMEEPPNGTSIGTPPAVQPRADLTSTREPSQPAGPDEIPRDSFSDTEADTPPSFKENLNGPGSETKGKPTSPTLDTPLFANEGDCDGVGGAALDERPCKRKRVAEDNGETLHAN